MTKSAKKAAARQVIPRSEHNISRANVSKPALKVLYRLKDNGFGAFLVGGAVRDLLLGGHPKDFDVATDATPEEVRKLFGNSRLIGRRFRLAHVRFGREIIEVATFRAAAAADDDDHQVAEASGRVLRDNVWGTLEDDVWRRDFTANALYYDIRDYSIHDYVGGVQDIRDRRLRLLGDPVQRYREDPVRMLRAVRFAAKLGFTIDRATAAPISELAHLLDNVPAARLFDEFGKLFQSGHALEAWRQMTTFGLLPHLFPFTHNWMRSLDTERRTAFIEQALQNTDERVRDEKPVTPMFLFAVFLWGPVQVRAEELVNEEGLSPIQALVAAGAELTAQQCTRIALPRRFSMPMREILQLQPRFERMSGKRAHDFLEHRRFRAAYDLFELRALLGEVKQGDVEWWERVQTLSAADRAEEFQVAKRPAGRRKRRRRSGKGKARPDDNSRG